MTLYTDDAPAGVIFNAHHMLKCLVVKHCGLPSMILTASDNSGG